VVAPIVALLDVRPELVIEDFVRERAILMACGIPGVIAKVDSIDVKRIELISVSSYTEIHEYISSEVASKSIELCGPGEETEITGFILMSADVQ
jgi:hypothetical protein